MQYSIIGFDQETILQINAEGHKIDITDLAILNWFVNFAPNMAKTIEDDQVYYWIKYEAVLADLPLLNIKKRMLYTRLQKMVDAKILTHYTKRTGGVYSMYGFGENYQRLLKGKRQRNEQVQNITDLSNGLHEQVQNIAEPCAINCRTKDPSTKHSGTKNNNTSGQAAKKKKCEAVNIPSYDELHERFQNRKVAETLVNWFEYKQERGDKPYTPIGMKSFLTTVERYIRNKGERGVCQCIELTMGSNYQGILWDKCEDTR